jgi:hypothetical protein
MLSSVMNLLQRNPCGYCDVFHLGSTANRLIGIGIKWFDEHPYALGIKFPVNCYTSKEIHVCAVTSGVNLPSLYIAGDDFNALLRTEMPLVDENKITGGGRICFRGDSRSPLTVFSRGINPRDTTSKIELRERGDEPIAIHKEDEMFYKRAGLNVSKSQDPAVLFPLLSTSP